MNADVMRDYLALLDEFGGLKDEEKLELAHKLRQFSGTREGRYLKFRALDVAYKMAQLALRSEDQESLMTAVSGMKVAESDAYDAEQFAKQTLDKPDKEKHRSHFR